ncbi:hypothetical protein [Allorhodopirellula solitaria]|uniref:Uncharacterized protein n=1 Tax=Allorhodopirellula solitaria TaxID=2527987 RepID=A0A5C5XXB1_9BACT|nr:hypothetical protein [Allorhodopirellula solitaria]TWT67338.1 hypothetical protein CA85_21880 [Allorhodopirellula solitaria]
MSSKTISSRFLTRSLAMTVAVACGVSLSSAAQAQMATGSGCTNCGTSAPVVSSAPVYGSAATTQYSQPVSTQSYPATSCCGGSTASHASVGSSCSGYSSKRHCGSSKRRCHSSRRSVVSYSQPRSSCGSTYSSTPVYSGGCGGSGSASYTTVSSYPSGGVVSQGTPVMQTGAGCVGGNCP